CAPFLLTMQIIFASVSYRRVVADLRLYSFRPAMAYMLDTMIDYYPNVEIYFLLNDGLGEEISESVRTICKHYQIDCIELKGLDKMSGHPSVKGMKQISEQVKAYMNSRHN
ncbi:SGNH/GDSL hydrolase family protein, partial [Phocaeicola dorei]|uniref:SGNH/GDSL hydrolase family protein n=1 Tax=Phocaeicola dorei TaxID=357276 RepID=UPI0039B4D4A2